MTIDRLIAVAEGIIILVLANILVGMNARVEKLESQPLPKPEASVTSITIDY